MSSTGRLSAGSAPAAPAGSPVGGGPPAVVLFDVNETLSDVSELGERFVDVGLEAEVAETWFASLLRDGFALSTVGAPAPFAELAEQTLRAVLSDKPVHRGPDAGVAHVLSAFDAFEVHGDVAAGIEALGTAGRRLAALSNASAETTAKLLAREGLTGLFEHLLSVEDAGAWKPAPAAYEYAARVCGVAPSEMLLVSVHPWDVDGAARAGLRTAWVDRTGSHYPTVFTAPDLRVTGIEDLAAQLAG